MTRRRGTNRVALGSWCARCDHARDRADRGLVTSAGGATAKHDAAPAATRTVAVQPHQRRTRPHQHVVVIVMENKQYSACDRQSLRAVSHRPCVPVAHSWAINYRRELVAVAAELPSR